jgi:hypothetical protein
MDTQLNPADPPEADAADGAYPEPTIDTKPEDADGDEPDATPEPTPRKSVFISHKRDFDLDQNIADKLCDDLSGDYDVFLDTRQQPGVYYEKVIKDSIKNAHYLLALITDNANNSEWVKAEIEYASECRAQQGTPVVIPVHIDFGDAYSMRLAACLSGLQRIEWNSLADYSQLLEQIQAVLAQKPPSPSVSAEVLGMESFLLRDSRKRRTSAAFLDALGETAPGAALKSAGLTLEAEKLLWVVGDAGVRNYVALSLAVGRRQSADGGAADAQKGEMVYEVTKSLSWSKVSNTMVRGSTIIFSNVSPAALFDVETPRDEFGSLERLIGRGNAVIVAISKESHAEIEQEMRKREFTRGGQIEVGRDFYDDPAKRHIFESLLKFSLDAGEISQKQYQWALYLSEESPELGGREQLRGESHDLFRTILTNWSPADIERFITIHLPQVKKPDDVHKLLLRNADLENEIHAWFVGLDDSTRCFVLALAMLSGLGRAELWEKYKSVIEALKKLDPSLALWPLGICRQRAADYVTVDGPVDFIDERIAETIYREIAKNFREYFIELLPLMRAWSVPLGRDQRSTDALLEGRRLKAAQGKELRLSIARMVGIVGRYGLGDMMSLLDHWATDPILAVRDAFAVSLEQAVAEGTGAGQGLGLLNTWASDTSAGGDTLLRVWAAAAALGNIVARKPGASVYRKALAQLETLASDKRPSVRFYVSIPLKKAARRGMLSDIESVLSAVAQDSKASTKINVAEALNEARLFDAPPALNLLGEWSSSQDVNQRWVATCSLVLWHVQSRRSIDQRLSEVAALLRQDAEPTAGVLVELMGHRLYQKKAVQLFKRLVESVTDDARKHLVDGLAALPFAVVDERVLARLRSSGKPEAETLVIEIRRECWRRQLANPVSFIKDLRDALNQEQSREEALLASMELLQPAPEGCRAGFRQALVEAFLQNRVGVNELLEKLSELAPPVFEPLSIEVRSAALRSLFDDPLAFVRVVSEDAARDKTAEQTYAALEVLAAPAPLGYYQELLRALADADAGDAAALRILLDLLRADGRAAFRQLSRDVTQSLLETEFARPAEFLGRVCGALANAGERDEIIQILDALSDSGPHGKRKSLVRVLAEAKITHPCEVDELLQSQWPQAQSALSGLRLEIKLASMLNSSFTPKFMSKLFNPKN